MCVCPRRTVSKGYTMTANALDPQQAAPKGTPQSPTDAPTQTLEALRASEARYRNLFEHAEDVIFSCTLDGILTSVKRATERLLGWPREALLGQHDSKILTPASIALGRERIRRSLAGERLPKLFEIEVVRRDGSLVPLVCQMMGGAIAVESTLGIGSTLTVRLPAEAVDPKTAACVWPGDTEPEEECNGKDPAS
jgi:PAS domain S-box-containing protein